VSLSFYQPLSPLLGFHSSSSEQLLHCTLQLQAVSAPVLPSPPPSLPAASATGFLGVPCLLQRLGARRSPPNQALLWASATGVAAFWGFPGSCACPCNAGPGLRLGLGFLARGLLCLKFCFGGWGGEGGGGKGLGFRGVLGCVRACLGGDESCVPGGV
jgi:hypothetical protein